MSQVLQQTPGERAHGVVVLDEQHASAS